MNLPRQVVMKEVGPRDGLQNEKQKILTEDKISFINQLSESGLKYIEVTSFVHPEWIPQLADAKDVLQSIKRNQTITYAALVPNMRGLIRALEVEVDEVSVFLSASETHNKNNINKTIDETIPILKEVVQEAIKANRSVRGYVSTVIGCPYEGYIEPEQVLKVVDALFNMGVTEVSLGDTIGVGVPTQVEKLLARLFNEYPPNVFAMHFHDTRGTALANIVKSLEMGITIFDSSVGGLGGCPYAKGATGNVATEDLLYLLTEMGIETGVNMEAILASAFFIEEKIGRKLGSKQLEIAKGERGLAHSDSKHTV
ncbi:hydroxymethylglutaryl-CoA lyase [Caldifermentibacillus hisashii]|uniref:hydroxymethylglutaryl-CoA lyase n=1 Tax=Caldifermentibacillus hisashii TaxID=996558 RepID=UPI0018509D36|nr:hydroxymethylglutaryl-CoA lyase [Caldifermentibacillus hisashii]NWN97113.1 hydroxymethylglutaryl-CoA lyase [Bacillus sp. (in: firmicutes)]